MQNNPPQLIIVGHSDSITALAFSADDKTLASGSYDQTAIVWNVATGTMRYLLPLHHFFSGLILTPDGQTLITDDGKVWKLSTGQVRRTSQDYLAPPRLLSRWCNSGEQHLQS